MSNGEETDSTDSPEVGITVSCLILVGLGILVVLAGLALSEYMKYFG